jgi:hypothetical protein
METSREEWVNTCMREWHRLELEHCSVAGTEGANKRTIWGSHGKRFRGTCCLDHQGGRSHLEKHREQRKYPKSLRINVGLKFVWKINKHLAHALCFVKDTNTSSNLQRYLQCAFMKTKSNHDWNYKRNASAAGIWSDVKLWSSKVNASSHKKICRQSQRKCFTKIKHKRRTVVTCQSPEKNCYKGHFDKSFQKVKYAIAAVGLSRPKTCCSFHNTEPTAEEDASQPLNRTCTCVGFVGRPRRGVCVKIDT